MKYILIALLAFFTLSAAQSAEPRASKKRVNKILKDIKGLNGNHIRVEKHNGDSIVDDIKRQLNEQFDDEKVSEAFKKTQIENRSLISCQVAE